MGLRRRCLSLRLRGGLTAIILAGCLVFIFLTYRLLSSQDYHGKLTPLPSLDHHRLHRLQAAKGKNPALPLQGRKNRVISPLKTSQAHTTERLSMSQPLETEEPIKQVRAFLQELYPDDWGTAKDPDEVALDMKHLLVELGFHSHLSCKDIDSLRISSSLAHSNKKYIERGEMGEGSGRRDVTIKSQSIDVETKIACMKKVYDSEHCSPMGNYKLLREILYLAVLQHPALVNMLGYCVRGDSISPEIRKKGLVLVTEMGIPVSAGVITTLPFHTRVQMARQLADLLLYLERSGLGSLGLGKLSVQDFVLVNNDHLKLVDLDEVQFQDKPCKTTEDCHISGRFQDIQCMAGECRGINSKSNMQHLATILFDPLLRNAPSQQSSSVNKLLDRLSQLQLSPAELASTLKVIQDSVKADHGGGGGGGQQAGDGAFGLGQSDQERERQRQLERQQEEERRRAMQREQNVNPDLNRADSPLAGQGARGTNYYVRYDQSNFPGMYDFPCTNSRVLWGCVITVRSIEEAKTACDDKPDCKAFVLFTSQPDVETLMTAVLKNSDSGSPQTNTGTTLFIKRPMRGGQQAEVVLERIRPVPTSKTTTTTTSSGSAGGSAGASNATKTPLAMGQCLRKSMTVYSSARRSRERRLMAHLGMKGLREKEWQTLVRQQKPVLFTGLFPVTGPGAQGGKFRVRFEEQTSSQTQLMKAVFMHEKGPGQYHVGHFVVYHVDRLLGLYHTPPTTTGRLSAATVEKFEKQSTWRNLFSTLTEPDGELKGLFVAPKPQVMKSEPLLVQPLSVMVTSVTAFLREQKLQLEYVFLWWLTKISKPKENHIGYSGHLVHFDGDQAFKDITRDLVGFLYHCQFPNVAFKTLACFRCHGNSPPSSICTLGQEVIRRVKSSGYTSAEIAIERHSETEMIILINDAASVALGVVDDCIKKFGREAVLY